MPTRPVIRKSAAADVGTRAEAVRDEMSLVEQAGDVLGVATAGLEV